MCPDDFGDICSNMFFLIQGFDKAQMNKTMIPEIIKVRFVDNHKHMIHNSLSCKLVTFI